MATKYEIRVRPVTRYIVTEWHQSGDGEVVGCGSCVYGEYGNEASAQFMAEALYAKRVAEKVGDVAPLPWHVTP